MAYRQESAEIIALNALTWLAGNDDLLPTFINSTGIAPSELRERAADAEFLASVLDFLLMDDAWVSGFCEVERLPFDALLAARQALPGGEQIHWT
jgi:hypothetical protein